MLRMTVQGLALGGAQPAWRVRPPDSDLTAGREVSAKDPGLTKPTLQPQLQVFPPGSEGRG